MKKIKTLWRRITFMMLFFTASLTMSFAQNLPYEIVNRSVYPDDQIYIALLGRVGEQSVWLDVSNGAINPINTGYNTVPGPNYGSPGPGGSSMYADCFRPLSSVPNSIIDLPKIASVRIFIAFNEQLYLYFFDDGGYSGPDLANETDPNQGIRFEIIELTYNDIGIWTNTTRVDHYQYPMGLEVWGENGFYKKVGEVIGHQEILDAWKARAPQQFQICLDEEKEIIHQPSKLPEFKEGGIYYNYFDSYVNQIWDRYMNEDLIIGIGDAGSWVGRVQADGQTFRFTRASDGRVAIVEARPNTQEIIEGKGVLAYDVPETPTADDLDVQKHFCAAFTRGVIDPNAPAGVGNDWSNEADFFINNTYNEYVKFWHSRDISWEGETYAFCYDDVFDYSSTVHTTAPTRAVITIGGFAGLNPTDITSVVVTPLNAEMLVGESQQYNAVAYDASGKEVSTTFSWSSNAPGGLFTATAQGTFTVSATAGGVTGTATAEVDIIPVNDNIALGKPIFASTVEGDYLPENAVDGIYDGGSRWSSEFADPQWIYVDFGMTYDIDRVVIEWEAAMGNNYDIQVSNDAVNWTTVRSVIGNTEAHNEETNLAANGRYLRIYGTTRVTSWGYSIWELEVYAGVTPPQLATIVVTPALVDLVVGDQQIFTAKGYDQNGAEMSITPTWTANAPNGLFTATEEGNFTVMVSQGTIFGSANVNVADPGTPTDNLAEGKPVFTSTAEGDYVGANAVDGSVNTRWSSVFADPQWIYVDLGKAYAIDRVVIEWEAAMGGDYDIQVSNDANSWTTVRSVVGNTAVHNEETGLNTNGRYLRIYGTARATGWGYSIWELEVYGEGSDPVIPPVSYFAHIEAEDYSQMLGVATEACIEGGENVGWVDAADWMDFIVSIPYTGEYAFTARIASDPGGGSLEVQEDGSTVGTFAIDATGGWQEWQSFTTTINLTEGTHTLRIYAPLGGWNINWFEIANDVEGPLYIPLHIEYSQYLRLGFSPADVTGMSELITQNISRDTCLYYEEDTTYTIDLIEKRRAEDVRFYTFNNGDRQDTIQGVPLTVTAYPGMEIFVDFIEVGPIDYPPIADAGNNDAHDLVEGDCYSLNGTNSFDPDGGVITAYSWTQILGPNAAGMSNPTGSTNRVCGLVEGEYQFELTVTDDEEAIGTDIIILTVIKEKADFALQVPANGTLISDTRTPQFTWESVAGAVRYDIYVNVTKENYDWRASGNLLDRYTKVGESTTNSFTMPYDLVDRWTYKWYVQAVTGSETLVSNKQQFGVYIPYLEEEADAISTAGGYRDMNKNGTMEPFENWRLAPEDRLNDLMTRLPLEEKFKQSYYRGGDVPDPRDGFGFSYGVEHIMKDEQYESAATPWGIPVAHAGDKIHGWKTIYPTQLGLAATMDPNIAYQCGNMQRIEHKSFGFAGTLTPLAEVDTKVLYPRFQEGNGENADEAAAIIRALVCGMQGGPEINPHSMLVTVKHWPSQGAGGEGPTQYDERTIGYHMKPWYAIVDANAASVMPGYSTSPFLDPTLAGSNSSKPIIDYLRDVIGFEGFIVTDWLAATTAQSIESMSAGIDVLGGAPSNLSDVNELVAAIGMARLEQACRRVLDMKIRLGLFENPYGDPTATWTNAEHHDIAVNAARKSITLIKNDGILPLNLGSGSEIVVGGPRATWEIKDQDPNVIWQSVFYDNPQTMNYFEAFAARSAGTGIAVVGGLGNNPNVAIVVIGEQGYTHGTEWADKDPDIPADQVNAIRDFYNRGIPVVTVVISPRPYVLTEIMDISSAVMLVYRGGNGIAQATAELCFGDFMPSGRLPFQLPRSQDQVGTDDLTNQIEHWELPYDIGATDAEREQIIYYMENDLPVPTDWGDPLYPYGWGLQNWNVSLTKAATEEVSTTQGVDSESSLQLYPNPVSGDLTINMANYRGDGCYEIISTSGEVILQGTTQQNQFVINTDMLSPGAYIFRVTLDAQVKNTVFFKK